MTATNKHAAIICFNTSLEFMQCNMNNINVLTPMPNKDATSSHASA